MVVAVALVMLTPRKRAKGNVEVRGSLRNRIV
jgi:hypothetical protein